MQNKILRIRKSYLIVQRLKNEELEELMKLITKFQRERRLKGETERIAYIYAKKAYTSTRDA